MSTSFPYFALSRRFEVPYSWVLSYVEFLDGRWNGISERWELTSEQQLIVFETRREEMARRRNVMSAAGVSEEK